MIFGQIPPIQVKAATVSKVYSTSELAYGGVNMVPSSLRYDDAFMSAYVYNGNRLNINSSFNHNCQNMEATKSPSVGERINEQCDIQTVEYYSVIK